MRRRKIMPLALFWLALMLQAQPTQDPPVAQPGREACAVAVVPIPAILDAFRSHEIVAIGNVESRGNEQVHAFQLSLIRNPAFQAIVNDIVVEFGNSRYQELADRFMRGEAVPYGTLRHIWQDTTQVEYEWDLPIYEDFFRAVQAINLARPGKTPLRVLLGDSPIDWDEVHNLQDLLKSMGDRDAHAAGILRREVLAKGRRALVIYGGQHLIRRNTVAGAADSWANGIVARLERAELARIFTILPETRRDLTALQPDSAPWPVPSLAILRGTMLGDVPWNPGAQRRAVRLEDQFDAVLYLGPPTSMTASKLSPSLCSDRAYMEMRLWRLNLVPPPPGAPSSLSDQLKRYCAQTETQAIR